jgi:hypothetical protein
MKRNGRAGHVALSKKVRNTSDILEEKLQGKRILEKTRRR